MIFWLIIFSLTSHADEPPVGVIRFKLDEPKLETLSQVQYVGGTQEKVSASCPKDFQISSASCDGSSRGLEKSFIQGDTSRLVFTKLIRLENQAECTAQLVRPGEFVKLSLTLNCESMPRFAQKQTP